MNAIMIEHVPVTELSQAWREKLSSAASATVTVRIEEEAQAAAQPPAARGRDAAQRAW
ncbi:hypothetical protein [Ramlibacter sp.]|uniref:hypothetical protein n=1 Tax=Ramlibacter sp. TaxID=1917967 RepID=UPI0035B4DD88